MRRPGSSARGDGTRPGRPARLDPAAATSARRPAPPEIDPDLVLLGEFGRAQGLRGELRLKSHTGDPAAIAGYGPLMTADGRALTLTEVRPVGGAGPDMLIVRVAGVADRSAAEALNRVKLYVPRARLGQPDEEDEVFAADLIGLAVVDAAGTHLGTVVAVPNYGGGDLLEIRPAPGIAGAGTTALLPFTKAFVPDLDVAGGRLVASLPEGFFDPPGEKPADDPG